MTPTRDPRGAAGSKVTVAPGIFSNQEDPKDAAIRKELGIDGWGIEPNFLVQSADLDGAGAALTAAANRFMHITELGTEVADIEEALSQGVYTPNSVSDVEVYDGGVIVHVNTKGELRQAMGDAMLRVLVEELDRRHLAAYVTSRRGYVRGEKWLPRH